MPTHNTLAGPFGPPGSRRLERARLRAVGRTYDDEYRERYDYAATTRTGRIIPFAVAAIGAAVILGTALLYSAGVVGAPPLNEGPEPLPMTGREWEPSPGWSRALGVEAQRNLYGWPGAHAPGTAQNVAPEPPAARGASDSASSGSLMPAPRVDETRGSSVDSALPPSTSENASDSQLGLESTPEGTEDLPIPADPTKSPPEGIADDVENPY